MTDADDRTNELLAAIPEDASAAALMLDGTVLFGDTITELVDQLIDGYADLAGDDAMLDARYDFAVAVANTRQAINALVASENGEFDQDVESEEVLTSIFSAKDVFVPSQAAWSHAVPLVLIATDYAPTTDRPRPDGNIQWVDPSNELTLLKSLAELGDFELFIRE